MTLTVVGCRVDWRKMLRLSQAYANILPLSGDFKVLDLRVDDIDLERFAVAPVMMIRMSLPRWMLIGRHRAFYSR